MRWLIVATVVLFVGCKDHRLPISDPVVMSGASLMPDKPNFGIDGIIEEKFGRLDSSGFVMLSTEGTVKAFIHDVNTWFQVPVNQVSGAPYVVLNGNIAQYKNFHGDRPYYLVVIE